MVVLASTSKGPQFKVGKGLYFVFLKKIRSQTSIFQPRLLELFSTIGIWTSLSKL